MYHVGVRVGCLSGPPKLVSKKMCLSCLKHLGISPYITLKHLRSSFDGCSSLSNVIPQGYGQRRVHEAS